jgi:serine/threonine protein kinase
MLILRGVVDGLAVLNSHNVVHRDIKPQNILIDENDEPFLTDFGLARLTEGPGMTRDGIFLGTPNYASPEQAEMKGVDERSDLYSLGVVLFEMLTGQKPFTATTTQEILGMHRSAVPPTPRDVRAGVPIDLSNLVLRCLEKNPASRCQSAGELRSVLESLRLG